MPESLCRSLFSLPNSSRASRGQNNHSDKREKSNLTPFWSRCEQQKRRDPKCSLALLRPIPQQAPTPPDLVFYWVQHLQNTAIMGVFSPSGHSSRPGTPPRLFPSAFSPNPSSQQATNAEGILLVCCEGQTFPSHRSHSAGQIRPPWSFPRL